MTTRSMRAVALAVSLAAIPAAAEPAPGAATSTSKFGLRLVREP